MANEPRGRGVGGRSWGELRPPERGTLGLFPLGLFPLGRFPLGRLRPLVLGGLRLSVLSAVIGCASQGSFAPPENGDGERSRSAAPETLDSTRANAPSEPGPSVAVEGVSSGAVSASRAVPAERAGAGPDGDDREAPGGDVRSLVDQGLARGDGTAVDALLGEGDDALRAGDGKRAAALFEKARQRAPRDPAPLVGWARATTLDVSLAYGAAQGEEAARLALEALDRALALDANFLVATLEKARLLLAQGDARSALPLLEECARRVPRDPEVQSAWGVALLATGDVSAAKERFEAAVQLEPWRAERFANLGTAQMMLGELASAVRSYGAAIRLAPDVAQYHGDLGIALLAQGNVEEARRYLTRAVALAPERATFLSNLAYLELSSGKLEEASRLARRATVLDPKLGSAWINLGVAEARLGRTEEAKRALQKALALDPTDPRATANWEELTGRPPP